MSNELADKLEVTDLTGIDVTDPQAVAALMGYDEQASGDQPAASNQGDTAAAPATSAPATEPAPQAASAPAAESSAAPAAAPAEAATEVAGVLTKDGKHVIPHTVLQDARRAASLERQKRLDLEAANRQLNEQLEAVKAGKAVDVGQAGTFTDAQLQEIREEIPMLVPFVDAVASMQKQLAQATAAPAAAPKPSPSEVADREVAGASVIDEAIAKTPLLNRLRASPGPLWQEAIAIDNELRTDPEFAGKPLDARLAEVQKRMSETFGLPIEIQKPTTTAAPAAATATPASAAPQVQTIMPTLTDLGGVGVSVATNPMAGMSPGQMVDKAREMDMEALRAMAGLSY